MPSDSIPRCPSWFVERLSMTMAKYINATMNELTPIAYWEELWRFHPRAVAEAFRTAAQDSPKFPPSALAVKEHAACHQKTVAAVQRQEHALLPEHDETLDPSHPHYETWQAVRRGEKTGAQAVAEVVRGLADSKSLTTDQPTREKP